MRATTRSVGMCASQFDNSSVKPSHSDCSDWSTLMSTSGSTTIVGNSSTTASTWNSLPGRCQATTANTSAARMLPTPAAMRFIGALRSDARRPMIVPVSNDVGTYWAGRVGMPAVGVSSSIRPMNR